MKVKVNTFDVLLADLSGSVDSEQGGTRPVVVIQNNAGNTFGNTTIVMPLSKHIKNINQPTRALTKKDKSNGLKTDSILLGEQIRVISEQRISHKLGTINDEEQRNKIKAVYNANFGL